MAIQFKHYGTPKEEQTKTVSITSNGTTEITPDSGKVLSKATANVALAFNGDAVASNVEAGKTFYSGSHTLITGNMQTFTPVSAYTQNGTLQTAGKKVLYDINIQVPTYITVASEEDLPSTADEGTIAIVEVSE